MVFSTTIPITIYTDNSMMKCTLNESNNNRTNANLPALVLGMVIVHPSARLQNQFCGVNEGPVVRYPSHPTMPLITVTGYNLTNRVHSCSFCREVGHCYGYKYPAVSKWGGVLLGKNKQEQINFVIYLRDLNSHLVITDSQSDHAAEKVITMTNTFSRRMSFIVFFH